ncbi:MAG: hypothetical protein JSU70_03875 [Phycisphaerales bacterium]|nr:MAG: hypothetical protein JSU70_03875 [Phycisphaerales bacterium]
MLRTSGMLAGTRLIIASVGTARAAILYGTARPGFYGDGDICEIDTDADTATLVVDISTVPVIPLDSMAPMTCVFSAPKCSFSGGMPFLTYFA